MNVILIVIRTVTGIVALTLVAGEATGYALNRTEPMPKIIASHHWP